MLRLVLLNFCFAICLSGFSKTIIVKNGDELAAANKNAAPGDIVILQNGNWENISIKLNCKGTKENPITFKAETAGKVTISGKSSLKIGGDYIIVDGLYFTNGYSGGEPVITFRSGKDQLATNCRVTNCVINDFNNPKRMDDNNWVTFYGKNNRLDHCSFKDKKNMGVLLAVILDDERSRENYHSIDYNYFGRRPVLGSNGGEIIRVGVSQHCQFNSNTKINNNFFEFCDGETEIVSIKSCSNIIQDNIFKESQGSLVLRHGDNNIVLGNLFLGNDKVATGGVRVINKGQVVRNNVFYKCRGTNFKAPLAVMNGIPNSPAHRYVQVTDAEIKNNIFYECSPLSFGEGSDAERSLPPDNVVFSNNNFYNTRDSIVYTTSDAISGIRFENNKVSTAVKQKLNSGFEKVILSAKNPATTKTVGDPIFASINMIPVVLKEATTSTGAAWFPKTETAKKTVALTVACATADDIYKQLERKEAVTIRLTGKEYSLTKPFLISKPVQIIGDPKTVLRFNTYNQLSAFAIAGNGDLSLSNLSIDGSNIKASAFISNDSNGQSNHYNLAVRNCKFEGFTNEIGFQDIFFAYKSMIADSIVFRNNSFTNIQGKIFTMDSETDNKGYYAAEKIIISQNQFSSITGTLLNLYRGGNDESTLGPNLLFSNNKITDCVSKSKSPLITLTGVQQSNISFNSFIKCNPDGTVILYKDIVRANHIFSKNKIEQSGTIEKNQFVTEK